MTTPSAQPMSARALATHRAQGARLFNRVWALLGTTGRTPDQDDEMVHAAHASAYHWLIAGNATNHVRSHWQCARVYAALNRPEPALWHAQKCLNLCADRVLSPFDTACAFEVQARAMSCAQRFVEARITLARARAVAAGVIDPGERAVIDEDIAATDRSIPR